MSTRRLKLALIAAEALIAATEWCADGTRTERGILVHARAAKRRAQEAIAEKSARGDTR